MTHPLCCLLQLVKLYFSCDLVLQAQVLYDFEGDAENDELNLKEGDVVTVLNQVHCLKQLLSSIDHVILSLPSLLL